MTISRPPWRRWGRRAATAAAAAVVSFLAMWLALATVTVRNMPELEPWHTLRLDGEVRASEIGPAFGWDDWLEREDRLFAELAARLAVGVPVGPDRAWNRYSPGGPVNPLTFARNWNRSFELAVDAPVAGALLLHGLSDSPYSLRSVAEMLHGRGIQVVGLRLPGHGTLPGELDTVHRDDWLAAAAMALRHVRAVVGEERPVLLVGYSNGAAVALRVSLDALLAGERPPDRLILLSPAIGVSELARVAGFHRMLSWMPWFEKLRWTDLEFEVEPYKYGSFTKNGGRQTYLLTREVQGRLDRLEAAGRLDEVPPVLAFASVADATVRVEAMVTGWFRRVGGAEDELVVFDVNRRAATMPFFVADPADRIRSLFPATGLHHRLTVITNVDPESAAVEERSWIAGTAEPRVRPLGLEWPAGVYSLSHVAVPFPPGDPINGRDGALGGLEVRGERGLLRVDTDWFARLRWNPFHCYLEQRVVETAPCPLEPGTILGDAAGGPLRLPEGALEGTDVNRLPP